MREGGANQARSEWRRLKASLDGEPWGLVGIYAAKSGSCKF